MSVQPKRLPTRFPVGTRYVVEGSGGPNGGLRIRSRYLEFPDGRHVDLPTDPLPPLRRRPRVRRTGRKKF
jgi:hypothetical protein